MHSSRQNKMINTNKQLIHKKSRPSHFLSIPIVSPSIKQAYSTLLNTPLFSSLDPQTLIQQDNLHITLGVMSLNTTDEISQATALLHDKCLPLIQSYQTSSAPLTIDLHQLDVMQCNPKSAHVLYVQVKDNSHNNSLYQLCNDINQIMVDNGLMEKDNRPLKLHVTLINTIYGKKRSNEMANSSNQREVSNESINTMDSNNNKEKDNHGKDNNKKRHFISKRSKQKKRISFDATSILDTYGDIHLGSFTLDKLHLMKMGRTGPSNTYETISFIPFL
ncbi:kinase A anchor protein [Cunninghamella echinulata]|nr:kinase A anchor protein [Cunninghamella echinulata]